MPGEAETRVKHAWEGGIPRHRPPSPSPSPSLPPPPPPLGTHQASGDFTTAGAGSHTPPGRRQGKETPLLPQPGSLRGWPGCPHACRGATEESLGWEVLLPPSPSLASMEPRLLSGVLDCIPSESGQSKPRAKNGFFQGHTGVGGGGGSGPQPTVVFTKCCCTPSISRDHRTIFHHI